MVINIVWCEGATHRPEKEVLRSRRRRPHSTVLYLDDMFVAIVGKMSIVLLFGRNSMRSRATREAPTLFRNFDIRGFSNLQRQANEGRPSILNYYAMNIKAWLDPIPCNVESDAAFWSAI